MIEFKKLYGTQNHFIFNFLLKKKRKKKKKLTFLKSLRFLRRNEGNVLSRNNE